MAERQTAMTPTREERRQGLTRQREWGGSPFQSLQRMADEMDRMFEELGFGRGRQQSFRSEGVADAWAPPIEVFQKNNELTIRAELPGVKREDVTVEVAENAVTIQGERKHEIEEEREGYYRSERSYGSFYRVIPLPDGAIADEAKARFKDGVLEVTMPAPPASKGRRLEIAEGGTK